MVEENDRAERGVIDTAGPHYAKTHKKDDGLRTGHYKGLR